jgi:glucose/arabinose dehydrogenase
MRVFRTTFASLLALGSSFAMAQAIPGLSVTPVAGSYNTPVAVRAPHDGSGRLFIVEKGGAIKVVKNGAALATPFLSLPVTTASESGLLGLAFHPNFGKVGLPHNNELYIAYTRPSGDARLGSTPDQAIARYTVPSLDSDVASSTGTLVLRVPDKAGNHNGGDIHFGPDGFLYYSMGDSGDQNDPHGFAQCLWKKAADSNPATCGTSTSGTQYFLLGKILRVDVDTRGGTPTNEMCGSVGIASTEYSIPAGNPFAGQSEKCQEIWAYGFRNPWRFSFDRESGDLIIGDVGQNAYEEVTVQPAGVAGGNHGWRACEGRHYFSPSGSGTNCPATTNTIAPAIEYSHSVGCAVTGGFVFRGPSSRLRGTYFYGDSCNGALWYATASGAIWDAGGVQNTGLSVGTPYGYGEDEYGNLYIAQSNGVVNRITSDFIYDNGFD